MWDRTICQAHLGDVNCGRGVSEGARGGMLAGMHGRETDRTVRRRPEYCERWSLEDHAAGQLNNRPRKCLNYRTPAEVFWRRPVALRM